MQCSNNLKQLGLAVHNYSDAHGTLPPARIAYQYPAWTVILLPYAEQENLFRQFDLRKQIGNQPADAMRTRVALYQCPSRSRSGQLSTQFNAAGTGQHGSLGDYATVDGPNADDPPYRRVSARGMLVSATGSVAAWRSQTTFASITDGTSNTLMMGEKHIRQGQAGTDDPGGDGPFLGSYAYSCMRVAGGRDMGATPNWPLAKGPTDDVGGQFQVVFGSAHTGVVNFVWGDGSVRALKTSVDTVTLARLAVRDDGQVVTLD